jgi:phosphoribosylamine--glycine ligase
MRVLLIGGGGREHALAWKLAQSPRLSALYAAPGNPGIARHATCVPIKADRIDALAAFAERERVDLTVVGPEAPLVAGIVDLFESRGLAIFGPSRAAAAIEGSKAFAKELMLRNGIPTAAFRTFTDRKEAEEYCRTRPAPIVVKASGLAGGKGAIVCPTQEHAVEATHAAWDMQLQLTVDEPKKLVVEEFMRGEEASFFALSSGAEAIPLGVAQDHKRVYDGDQGPNTGGMGAYSPAPIVDEPTAALVMERIIRPTIGALAAEGRPYRGLLYAGLMLTSEGPKVLEFNCRFGDPECQAVLMRLADDLLPLLHAAATGAALPVSVTWGTGAAVCVVLASHGYPGEYPTGLPIAGVDEAEAVPGVVVFHAGTARKDGTLVTAGGRVLGVTARGDSISAATDLAYRGVDRVCFQGMHYRKDIARRR